jgi:hypothetical protein
MDLALYMQLQREWYHMAIVSAIQVAHTSVATSLLVKWLPAAVIAVLLVQIKESSWNTVS